MAERMTAAGAFSYACARCRRCCTGKRIRVNPYEVYRLARARNMTTTDFLAVHTVEGGTELAVRDDGSCVFLGEHGCTVHADRPLVCRLYPLGREVELGTPDRYFHLEPHPESEGVYGTAGTIDEFLAQQGAAPFLDAADRYLALIEELSDTLAALAPAEVESAHPGRDVAHGSPAEPLSEWLDIDAVLSYGVALPPASAEEAMTRHIAALDAWRRSLSPRGTHDEQVS